MKNLILSIIVFAILGLTSTFAQTKYVSVRVDGLSCPFCAYGLEKKFSKIDGAKDIKIDVDNGLLTFNMVNNKVVTEEEIQKRVKQAGFTPKEISFSNLVAKEEDDE